MTGADMQLSAALLRVLSAEGWRCVWVGLPGTATPNNLEGAVGYLSLASTDDAALQGVVDDVENRFGMISAFVTLSPPAATPEMVFDQGQVARLEQIFSLARFLKTPLHHASAKGRRAVFITVTRMDGLLGTGGMGYCATDGGYAGLVKTLQTEWPVVFCRAIDIDPGWPLEQAVVSIWAELHDPDRRIREVGIGPRGRMTITGSKEALCLP